jgi:hypothetical protein
MLIRNDARTGELSGKPSIRPRLVALTLALNFFELIDASDPVIPRPINVTKVADAVHFGSAENMGFQRGAQSGELGAVQPMQKIPKQTYIEHHAIVSVEGGNKSFSPRVLTQDFRQV